jgi:hypothetical protein
MKENRGINNPTSTFNSVYDHKSASSTGRLLLGSKTASDGNIRPMSKRQPITL